MKREISAGLLVFKGDLQCSSSMGTDTRLLHPNSSIFTPP